MIRVLYSATQKEYEIGYKLAFLKEVFVILFINKYLLSSGTMANVMGQISSTWVHQWLQEDKSYKGRPWFFFSEVMLGNLPEEVLYMVKGLFGEVEGWEKMELPLRSNAEYTGAEGKISWLNPVSPQRVWLRLKYHFKKTVWVCESHWGFYSCRTLNSLRIDALIIKEIKCCIKSNTMFMPKQSFRVHNNKCTR